jgi:hypothetical protein
MHIIAILMGWPSLAAALLLSAAGVWSRKPVLIWIGVILSLPMALYISATPRFPLVGFIPLVALVVAALTCRRNARWPTLTGIAIYSAFIVALAFAVFFEPNS